MPSKRNGKLKTVQTEGNAKNDTKGSGKPVLNFSKYAVAFAIVLWVATPSKFIISPMQF